MIHINRFIDKITATEAKGNPSAQFPMSLKEAKDLHADITKLLLHLQQLNSEKTSSNEIIQVEVSGDKW
jgi:hypothetical protein